MPPLILSVGCVAGLSSVTSWPLGEMMTVVVVVVYLERGVYVWVGGPIT
jgi:hypothetical protein